MKSKEILRGLDCYDPEGRIFPHISRLSPPRVEPLELALILKWKFGRFKKTDKAIIKRIKVINKAIRLAATCGKEIDAVTALCTIKGIKISGASAILTICYPDRFTIIDKRVLDMLSISPSDASKWTPADYWSRFVPLIQTFSKRHALTLRQADQVLWGASVFRDIRARMK